MRKILIAVSAAVLAVIIAGTAAFSIRERSRAALAQAVAQIRSALGPRGAFSYASAAIHPFSRSAELDQVAIEHGDERVTARRLSLTAAGGLISSLHATDLRLIEPAWPGTVVTMSDLEASGIHPSPTRDDPFDAASLRIDHLRIDGLTVRTSAGSADIATIKLDHYGPGERPSVTMRGFSASLERAGADTRIAFRAAAGSGTPAFDTGPGEGHLAIDRLSIMGPSFTLEAGQAAFARLAMPRRIVGGLALNDVRIVSPGLAALTSAGLTGSLVERVAIDLAAHTLDLSPARLVLAGLGALDLRVDLGQVNVSALSGRPSAAEIGRAIAGVQLVSLHLALHDGGFLDRLARLASRRTGLTPAQTRHQAAARIERDPSLDGMAGSDHIRSTLASFVAHGGTIELDLHPPAPISPLAVVEIARIDPAGAIARLGLTLTDASSGQEP